MTINPPPPAQPFLDADQVLDVRAIPCAVKHGLIIRQWLNLPVGGHFILLNHHDPVPLRHQFAAQWPGAFTWEYLVNEPEECRIEITKLKSAAPPAQVIECGGGH